MGTLFVPSGVTSGQSRLNVKVIVSQDPSERQLLSQVTSFFLVEITLQDSNGCYVQILDLPLTICLTTIAGLGENAFEKCLGFFDTEMGIWRCQDSSLERLLNSNDDQSTFCGITPHLTSFALLLTGIDNNKDQSLDRVLSWLSLAFVGFAIIIVLASIMLIEVYIRSSTYLLNRKLNALGQKVSDQQI